MTTPSATRTTSALLRRVRACTLCAADLPLGPRPILQVHPDARILIAGQAPGARVHASGIPFQDPSGERLRDWLGIDAASFYDPAQIAIVPMGFCYPGTGTSGDLPPRPEGVIDVYHPVADGVERVHDVRLVRPPEVR